MQIHFQTSAWAPPWTVSLRVGTTVPTEEYFGYYRDACWTFEVPGDLGEFLLALDGMAVAGPFTAAKYTTIRENEVHFDTPAVWAERGRLQCAWFPVGQDQASWDVIVVGTGMGGGTLLYQLAEQAAPKGKPDLRVLGLEAGPLMLPTHVANLPRRVYEPSAMQASSMWGLYEQLGSTPFGVQSIVPFQGASWGGREIFGLGGRSLMWGGLCPRLSEADAQDWPSTVVDELTRTWYARAESLMNVGCPDDSPAQAEARARLGKIDALSGRRTEAAPVAVERETPSSWRVPSGMFSTADLLLTARLRVPHGGDVKAENWPPYVHLSEVVTGVVRDDASNMWTVHTTTVSDGVARQYQTRAVVLAAGTVETARIALASGINGPLVGTGVSEHAMWWAHFQVPDTSALASPEDSVKLLSIPVGLAQGWNLLVEVNVDLNEERLPDRALRQPYLQVDSGHVGGQMVFLCRGALDDSQSVATTPGRWPSFNQPDRHTLPNVELHLKPDTKDAPPELQKVADEVAAALEARPMPQQGGITLSPAARGYVAHEVGTMRMPGRVNGCVTPASVVSEDLEVVGHAGLFVCDNSVFPACPAANPSLTLAALALRLADHLLDVL